MAIIQVLTENEPRPLNISQIGIGRAPDNEIAIDDETISSYHALITIRPSELDESVDEYILEDLDSTNKTYVNNKAVRKIKLKHGDLIRVGETRMKFSLQDFQPPEKDFQKTRKMSSVSVSSYLYKK